MRKSLTVFEDVGGTVAMMTRFKTMKIKTVSAVIALLVAFFGMPLAGFAQLAPPPYSITLGPGAGTTNINVADIEALVAGCIPPTAPRVMGVVQSASPFGIGPSNGTVTLDIDPVGDDFFVYNGTNFCAACGDSFMYTVVCTDGVVTNATGTGIVYIAYSAPAVVDDAYNASEDTVFTNAAPGVLGNDTYNCVTAMQAVVNGTTTNGVLALEADGSFAYTPATNFCGVDSFTYHAVANCGSTSGLATVTITVAGVNDAPTAVDDAYNVTEDIPVIVLAPGVLVNDSDVDAAGLCGLTNLAAVLVTAVTNGTLTLSANGSFNYASDAGFCGIDSFSYVATDSALTSGVALVTLTVTGSNDAPVALSDSFIGTEDMPFTGTVITNDTDSDIASSCGCTTLSTILCSTSTVGDLVFNSDGSFTLTPPDNFCGLAFFMYQVTDGCATSACITASVDFEKVNDLPTAVADGIYVTTESVALVVSAPGVLANDTDADLGGSCGCSSAIAGEVLVAELCEGIVGLVLNADGSFTYTPAANSCGQTSFTYRVTDGCATSACVAVTIDIEGINDCPVKRPGYTPIVREIFEPMTNPVPNPYIVTQVFTFAELVTDRYMDPDAPGVCGDTNMVYSVSPLPEDQPDYGILTVDSGSGETFLVLEIPDTAWPCGVCTYTETKWVANVFDTSGDCIPGDREEVFIRFVATDSAPVAPNINIMGTGCLPEDQVLVIPDVSVLLPAYIANPDNCCQAFALELVGCCTSVVSQCPLGTFIENLTIGLWPTAAFTAVVDGVTVAFTGTTNGNEVVTAMGGHATLDGSQIRYTPPANWPLCDSGIDYIPYVIVEQDIYAGACDNTNNTATGVISVVVCKVCDVPVTVADTVELCEDTTKSIALGDLVGNDYDVDFAPSNLVAYTGVNGIGFSMLGTAGTPVSVGGITLLPFATNTQLAVGDGNSASVIDSGSCVQGAIELAAAMELSVVPTSWSTWSHGYAGPVWFLDSTTQTILLPPNTTAFSFYLEPSDFGLSEVYAVANDGTTSTVVQVLGHAGAQGIAFYAQTPGKVLTHIVINVAASANGFAIGEFAIGNAPIAYVVNVGGVLGPTNGELVINGYVGPVGSIATNLQYRPEPHFYGTDSFSYTLCTIEECNDVMVTNYVNGMVNVIVHPVSDLPTVATDDAYPGVEDTALTISMASLLANDTDGGDQGLNAANIVPESLEVKSYAPASANGGTISQVGSNLVYTPALNFYGTDTFTYVAGEVLDAMKPSCQVAQVDTATVTICVAPVNDPSVPMADNYAIDENELISSTVSNNDTDVEGQMSFYLHPLVNVSHGRLTFNVDGSFTYLPATNWNGTDGFTYYVVDGGQTNGCGTSVNNTSAPVRVYIQVADVNSCPTADDKSMAVLEDSFANIQLTGTDVEEYGYVARYVIVTPPANGTVSPMSGNGQSINVVYRPGANYCGSDSFTYSAVDNVGCTSTPATVSITVDFVNDAPVAVDDAVSTPEDTAIVVTPAANDTDADTATVCGSGINRIQIADQPQHGTVIKSGMSISYTPDADYCGEDQFTYIVYDGANASDEGAVVITVTAVNDQPVANDLVINTEEDKPVAGQVTAIDDDFGTCQTEALVFAIESNGAKGTALMNPDGSFTYTPTACESGADSVTYRVTDLAGAFDIGQIAINIVAINDSPVAADDSATTDEDMPVTVNVLANDEDGDCETNQVLNVVLASGPSYGTAQVVANQIVYTPASNYFGPDALSYYITDVTGQPDSRQSGVANVSITVASVNDQPVADDKAATCIEDQTTAAVTPSGVDVEDGTALSYVIVALPMHGSVVTNAGGQFIYAPATDYCGPDSFSYVAIDSASLASAAAQVTIAVECTPDVPTAMNQTTQTFMRVPVSVSVPAADMDVGYTNASAHNIVILSSLASNGTVEVDGLVVTFAPSSAFKGQHVIEYKLVDGEGAESTNYTITVNVVVKRGVLGDYNADGSADLSVVQKATKPATNANYFVRDADSGATILFYAGWGWNKTVPVPGDYDGDGTTDRAAYQEETGNWFLHYSNMVIKVATWGYAGTIPVPADYDGDGITDLAVMDRSSFIWYVLKSTDGQMIEWQWGYPGCVPVPADYDGDGMTDRAVYNASAGTWYIVGSKGSYHAIHWGWVGAKAAPADFNGDGAADVAVVFNGVWYTYDYANNAVLGWGDVTGGMGVAVPADYDGDGMAERAVYEEATGIWTIQDVGVQAWGFPGAKSAVTAETAVPNY